MLIFQALRQLLVSFAIGLSASCVSAASQGLPNQALHLDQTASSQTHRLEYTGDVTLNGLLQAYWVVSWPDGVHEQRQLYLRFFPDSAARAALPTLTGDGLPAAAPNVIHLYHGTRPPADGVFASDYPLDLAIPLLEQDFPSLDSDFLRYREGQALSRVQVQLQALSVLIECDRRHAFGAYTTIKPLPAKSTPPETLSAAEQGSDCGSQAPYIEHFVLAPATAILRQHPSADSPSVRVLPVGTQVLKRRTANEHWLEVDTQDGAHGYLERAQLQVIH